MKYKADIMPKPGSWPGAFEAYKLVKPHVKPRIWDFVSIIGIGIILSLLVDIVLSIIFKHSLFSSLIDDVVSLLIGGFIQSTMIYMYFLVLSGSEFSLNEAMTFGFNRILKMSGLLIIMYVVLIASFILLIVPFFFVLPRVYLAPYYLIAADCTTGEALAASWHSTKSNEGKVYGIIGIDVLLAILFITIIGIPFALYFGIINTGSFALLTMYLSQPKNSKKASKVAEAS